MEYKQTDIVGTTNDIKRDRIAVLNGCIKELERNLIYCTNYQERTRLNFEKSFLIQEKMKLEDDVINSVIQVE